MTDLFSNPSNDYINPSLPPCTNVSDSQKFKFLADGAAIVGGTEILQFLDLSNISISVNSWTGEKKTLQSGEVTYIPGLTKGLLNKTQKFHIPNLNGGANQKYYMMVDLSMNYYYNFRYFDNDIDVSSNYSNNVDIDDALNIALGNNNIKSTFTYDPSYFTIVGDMAGYDFDVTNMVLTLIDASLDSTSPFPAIIVDGQRVPQTYSLVEDINAALPSAKYPNGAMLGYVLKATYPAEECCYTNWLYMNNVKSSFDVYIPTSITNITDISTYKTLEFDPSITWGPFISEVSSLASYDPSYGTPIDASIVLNTTITNLAYNDSSIIDSIAIESGLFNSYIEDSSIYGSDVSTGDINNSYLVNSKIILSTILDSNLQDVISNDNIISNGEIKNSYLNIESSINNSTIEGSWINAFEIVSGLWANDVSCVRISINDGIIHDTSINNAIVSDVSIYTSQIYDSSLVRCTIYNTELSNTDVDDYTRNIYINPTFDASLTWNQDTSTFYNKFTKKIDVGMSGTGDTTTLSAGDYLDYINSNNLWDKVGPFAAHIGCKDPAESSVKNLIGGFYVFNPQLYPVQIEYILIN